MTIGDINAHNREVDRLQIECLDDDLKALLQDVNLEYVSIERLLRIQEIRLLRAIFLQFDVIE